MKIIALYPGRFQPFGSHHAKAFEWLQKKFGSDNCYIVTSDVVKPPKSPFTFEEKKAIISTYGLGNRLVQVKNPYQATEIMSKYNPEETAVVFMVGDKDMKEDPRFTVGTRKSDGAPTYFQSYDKNKDSLLPFNKHGYLIVAPHIGIDIPGYGELSGTASRKALGDKSLDLNKRNEIFKGIFGWEPKKYPKVANMIFSKLEGLDEGVFTSRWWKSIISEIIAEEIIIEGGAGGHMAHPFNVDWVHTGRDLLKLFQMSVNYLKNGPASVKIDGINASIRFITLDAKKQFVLDRGSNKPLDVKGITKDDLLSRFGEGHGMIKIGGTVLEIFNKAIPTITKDLKKLGMWENPNIMFNIEYVAGSSNVLSYNKNFLAIHGLLEIEQLTPTRRGTKEIHYDKSAMQDLLNNLSPIAAKYGYEVLGSIPTQLDGEPDLKSELNKQYTINFGSTKETKTLSQWLSKVVIPTNKIKLTDGKVVDALSKEVLVRLNAGDKTLNEIVLDPKDFKSAIDGYFTYIATMKLGDAILNKLSSPLGPVHEHEGIVIRDAKISDKPFKITGKFILGGMNSQFGQK